MRLKSSYLLTAFLLAGATLGAQSGYCLKYAGITDNATTDTLHVFNLNGDSFNQLTRVSDGQSAYRTLKLKNKAAENYILYTDNSYRMIPDVQMKEYVVKVLGKEQVNGYNCTKISLLTFQNGNLCYLWVSDEVPDYKNYLNCSVIDFKLDRLAEALKKQGLAGIPVKIAYKVPDNLWYQLVSAGSCTPKAELFDLGRYTNAKTKSAE